MDGMLKHLTESRNFEHRLRALENEVTALFAALLSLLNAHGKQIFSGRAK